ncbi:MAG: spermidine/putrescine ABC transporter ATP-binding protein [Peptostreptococcaceae bacterium]
MENIIELKDIDKSYDDVKILDKLNLSIKKNEFLTLLGPSGCGKTTTLKIIAGFEFADSGEVIFENNNVNEFPPHKRPLNTVFQKYALFPHMNIYENIAFGLKIKKMPKDEIEKKVKEMLKLVSLEGYEKRSVDSLSGGQQQRIAIARALVNEPKVLLLDEPLGALDLKLRQEMQTELKRIQQKLGITFIFVTHDQEEALSMSDTIVVMNKGVIQQMGTPEDIYNEPQNSFVARFIGESNIFDGIMLEDFKVEFLGRVFECVDKGFDKNENIEVVIRPEDIKMVDSGIINGEVTSCVFKGVHYEITVKENDKYFIIHNTKSAVIGQKLGMDIYPEDIHIMKKG